MKTKPQSNADLSLLADKLERFRVAMLTLNEPDAGLAGRPMTPLEMDHSGAIWFMASHQSMRAALGEGEAVANLSFTHESDNDFISISGHASLVDDAARKEELWSLMGRPWFDGPKDPDLTLIRFTPRRAELWDGPDNAVTRVLAMAASVAAGREVGMGTKTQIEASSARN